MRPAPVGTLAWVPKPSLRDTDGSLVLKDDLSLHEECLTWIRQGEYLGRKKALLNLEKGLLRRVELVRFGTSLQRTRFLTRFICVCARARARMCT